jgi:hypothetical protein
MGHQRLSRKLAIYPKPIDFNTLAATEEPFDRLTQPLRTTTVRDCPLDCAKIVHRSCRD